MIYVDGKTGISYAKRFNVTSITRDREYDLTKGNANSKVSYFTANPNGEAEVITITLSPGSKARNKVFDYYFEELDIKGRSAGGNQVTKYPIKSIRFKEKGRSTLEGQKIWFNDSVGRLNKDGDGILLGMFDLTDRVIAFYKDGTYELTDFELTNRYEIDDLIKIERFDPEKVVSAIYFDAKSQHFFAKRFKIESQTLKSKYHFIKEGEGNYLQFVTTAAEPILLLKSGKKKSELEEEEVTLNEIIDITGWKTIGTRFADNNLKEITLVDKNEEKDELTLF